MCEMLSKMNNSLINTQHIFEAGLFRMVAVNWIQLHIGVSNTKLALNRLKLLRKFACIQIVEVFHFRHFCARFSD